MSNNLGKKLSGLDLAVQILTYQGTKCTLPRGFAVIVSDKLLAARDQMTPSERQLITVLLDDYPIAGLGSITDLASAASVSTTTVARMLQKIGFDGYPPFQAALRAELKQMISDPIAKHAVWQTGLPDEHILNRYSKQAIQNQERSLNDVRPEDFDACCQLLSDTGRQIFVTGGRISGTLAQYAFLHLQVIRADVRLIPSSGSWPHYLLDMKEGDVLIVFDLRRYENNTLQLAQMCHDKGARVVLFTDHWRSPIHRHAAVTFAARIAVPSAWDSSLSIMMLVECAIAAVQENLWDNVQQRMGELEDAFDKTRLFRKFT